MITLQQGARSWLQTGDNAFWPVTFIPREVPSSDYWLLFLWPCIFIVFSTNVLGVHLDTDLLFNTHAIETAKKANEKIYLTSKIKKYLTVDDALKA